jgi:small subunit ribosomal protein S1
MTALAQALSGAEEAVRAALGGTELDGPVEQALAEEPDAAAASRLAALLAEAQRPDLAIRVLQAAAGRAEGAERARLHNLRGLLLADAGHLTEAGDALQEALADAGDDAPRVRVNLAALALARGDLAGAKEAQSGLTDPRLVFTSCFTRLQAEVLREERWAVPQTAEALAAAATAVQESLPAGHPAVVTTLADLAYGRFQAARLAGDTERLDALLTALSGAVRLVGAAFGIDHPRALAARVRLTECELAAGADPAAVLDDSLRTARWALRRLGPDHPQTLAASAQAGVAQLAAARRDGAADALAEAARQLAGVAEDAGRTLGPVHPVTVVALAGGALAELAAAARARSAELAGTAADHLAEASTPIGRALGPAHSTAALVYRSLRACRQVLNAPGDDEAWRSVDAALDATGSDEIIRPVNDGDTLSGTVVRADRGEVLVDVGYTADGVIPSRELPRDAAPLAVGDRVEAVVLTTADPQGRLILSQKRADQERTWDRIEKLRDGDQPVQGKVVEVVKGGLIVDIGLRAFLPASLVELRRVRDLRPYLGRELELKILEMDRGRGNVVLSRRAALEQAKTANRADVLGSLQKGQIRKGVVSSIVNFGVFVDLGGVDGLVHVSELSWRHVNHPSEVVQVGQEVSVEITEVDNDRGRVSLSYRSTQEDPWHEFARENAIGQIVPGTVTKLVPFGVFVRLDDGIEGLVHISELADSHVEQPDQVTRAGAAVFVKVLDIDLRRRRISLSLKQADEAVTDDDEYFDPTMYGMAAAYDAEGNYIYPEGFDPETGEWLEGYEAQRDAWEGEYERARQRFEAHTSQVRQRREGGPVTPPPVETDVGEALAALRERLAADRDG